jgi:hypothetical protein
VPGIAPDGSASANDTAMSLESAQKEAIAGAIRRSAAIATLGRVRQHIEEEHAEDVQARKFAGAVTGVVFGLAFEYMLLLVVKGMLATSRSSPLAGAEWVGTFCWLVVLCAGTTGFLGLAFYFIRAYPRSLRPYVARPAALSIAAAIVLILADAFLTPITACHVGDAARAKRLYESAIREYSTCLGYPNLTEQARAEVLLSRARTYSTVDKYSRAVADYEEAFKLHAPARAAELQAYAFALLESGRPAKAIEATVAAERADGERVSANTAYTRGRALLDLKRYDEAVESLTRGIERKPSFAYFYWYRALAYEGSGRRDLARADFEALAKHIGQGERPLTGIDMQHLREKLRAHRLAEKYPL